MLEEQLGPTQFETVDANAGVVQLRGVAATFDRRICEIWMVRIRANDMFNFYQKVEECKIWRIEFTDI